MKVSDFLSSADIVTDIAATDKPKLLEALARKAGAIADLPPEAILAALLKREELGSTGVGGGIAIPHARFASLRKPAALLTRLKKPIDFDAVDGKPVDTVVLLLLPELADNAPLGALACVTRKLRDPAIMTALRNAGDHAKIYRALTAE